MSEEELKAIDYIGNTTFKFLEHPFCNINKVEMNLYDFKQIEILLNLIEKQQKEIEKLRIKNGKEFARGMETNEKSWQVKIKDKIETIKNETWYVDGSAEARQACIDELMSL